MWLQGTRYGYVITDRELLCVHRPGDIYGCLELADPIDLNVHDGHHSWTPQSGQFTVFSALWFLHMLADTDGAWQSPQPPKQQQRLQRLR
ncbi:hypothetical protein K440DRAFT_635313 [Wilcoxina mikolae CBS 423.85]|nr:hypothetical protein K440DRAFT_635313 [Wilcoxina mikolae CBS 423.85]